MLQNLIKNLKLINMEFYSKEIQILRQSQQKMVLDYLKEQQVKVTMEQLQRITDLFVECCLRPQDEDLKKRIVAFDKWVLEQYTSQNNPK